jgi:hypothetical protein
MKLFDIKSPGFLYSVIASALTIFAATGVHFPGTPESVSGEIVTSLSTSGIYGMILLLGTSIAFPIYNWFKSGGKFSLKAIFSKVSTWISLGVTAASGLALTGFVLPDGTVEQIAGLIVAKDWIGLGSILVLTIGNTIVRFIKDRKFTPPIVG